MISNSSAANSFEYQMPNLDIPNPPADLAYSAFEDFRNREILKVNGISLSEAGLKAALEHQNNILQAAAAHVVGSLSNRSDTATLERLLSSSDDLVKVEAAYALARLGVSSGKAGLIGCLGYPVDAYLCPAIAAGYLAQLEDPQGFPIIAKSFEADIPAVRMLACKQLYFFVPFSGLPDSTGAPIDIFRQFQRALKDADSNVQWQAVMQLREIHSGEAQKLLKDVSEGAGDVQLRDVAKAALINLEQSEESQLKNMDKEDS